MSSVKKYCPLGLLEIWHFLALGTSGTVGNFWFAGGFVVDLVEDIVAKTSTFSSAEIIIEPSSAMSRRKELSLKLLLTCLVRLQNARLPLRHLKIVSRLCL